MLLCTFLFAVILNVGLVLSFIPQKFPSQKFNILEFGAVGDNATMNTLPISKAIETASNFGGGIVLVPKGVFLTGALNLTSNVYLYLEKGAALQASNDVNDYPYDWDR